MKPQWRTNKRGDHYVKKPKVYTRVDSAAEDAARPSQMSLSDFIPSTDDAVARYKAKREGKATRYRELAKKRAGESKSAFAASDRISDMIPMGQPILVGHHSEKGHRRDLERIRRGMEKGIELKEKAEYYEKKAELAENPRAISSDDPEAVKKLKEELAELEARREKVKTLPIKPRDYSFSDIDMRSVHLTNLGANIRRIEKRIDELQKVQAMPAEEKKINNVRIVTDKDDNRVKIFFPSIPPPEIRQKLKQNGFKWSPTNQAWQRMISNAATYWAEDIVKDYK